MPKLDMACSNRVIARDRWGRFQRNIENASSEAVRELIEEGMNISRAMAPVGQKHDKRTLPLRDSLFMVMETATRGYWGSSARHALHQEYGTDPHTIPGHPNLAFFWEAAGRNWIPASIYYNTPGLQDMVNHPGHGAQPFLRPAYEIIRDKMQDKLRQKMANI